MARRRAAAAGLGLALLAAAPARADEPVFPSLAPVVVRGARLGRADGAAIAQLRLYAWRDGGPRPIPFQVDERTPGEVYALDQGDHRQGDSDDGRLDGNDELVFMARDAGAQAPGPLDLGQRGQTELELVCPRTGARGWVYLLEFERGAAPAPAEEDHARLVIEDGEPVALEGRLYRAGLARPCVNALDLRELRFAREGEGEWGPDVLDRAKLDLGLHYLFLDVERTLEEVRAGLLAWRDGPVRVLARPRAEVYLIWGHWIRTTARPVLRAYGDRIELELELTLPEDLEPTRPSELRLSLDLDPAMGDVRVTTSGAPGGVLAGAGGLTGGRLPPALPAWVCLSGREGALLVRLRIGPELQRPGHGLYFAHGPTPDPPEDVPGSWGNGGFRLDLTGLPAGDYGLGLTLQLSRPIGPGGEAELLAVDEAPLEVRVR